ncbi:hypothetical protein ACIRF8_15485 [Streptomyces sp. NPDC102406]|uniref:hypothetical protein n=1 Tax=Streptomyces sp. NPDC102406 TaxID=3366171 RepID=UPI00382AE83E
MDSNRIADGAEQQPDRIRLLEQRAIADATHPLAQALTDAQATALTRWVRETISTQIPAQLADFIDWVRDLLRNAFHGKSRQAQADAERAAFTAAQQGVQHASQLAAVMTGQPVPPIASEPGADAKAAADSIPAAIQAEHSHALALLTTAGLTATGLAGLNSVFKRARRAVGRIATAMAVAIGSAAAHGPLLVARALDARLLWVTEPGACPACRAYAGLTVKPGHLFPGGLSLDPRRTVFTAAIPGPPRHPFCRCALVPWSPTWRLDGTPLSQLLRQRARTNRRT